MQETLVNGVDVTALGKIIHEVRLDPELGRFEFRLRNRWLERGGHSRSTITAFYGTGRELDGRSFHLEQDEHPVMLGEDAAPNPVEHLLNALAGCLTGALVYHAAARGIHVEACECELRGEADLRGFLGISNDVRRGFSSITAHFRVLSDGDPAVLEDCARYSPVLDVVLHGTKVDIEIEPMEESSTRIPMDAGVEANPY